MLLEKPFDDGSKLGISGFRGIGGHTGDFSQYVASAFVSGTAILDGRGILTYGVFDALRFSFIQNSDEGLQGTQAARKATIGVGVDQHLTDFIYSQPVVQSCGKGGFQVLQIAPARAGGDFHDGLLTQGQPVGFVFVRHDSAVQASLTALAVPSTVRCGGLRHCIDYCHKADADCYIYSSHILRHYSFLPKKSVSFPTAISTYSGT